MPPQAPASQETPRDPIEIRQDAAIGIQDALLISAEEAFPIGKSTLQRWARHWAEQGRLSPVKSILVTNRTGSAYRLDRDDFTAWLFEQKNNARSQETPRDPMGPHETPRDLTGSHETSRGAEKPQQTSREFASSHETVADDDAVAQLREENMQLKIDLEVRKRLLSQAAAEIGRQRDQTESLLRENGALGLQVRQLADGRAAGDRISASHDGARTREGSDGPAVHVHNQHSSIIEGI